MKTPSMRMGKMGSGKPKGMKGMKMPAPKAMKMPKVSGGVPMSVPSGNALKPSKKGGF